MSSQMTKTDRRYSDHQYSQMLLGLGAFIALGCGIAVGAVFGDSVRLVVWIVLGTAVAIGARRNRLDVVVSEHGIELGRARLPWSAVQRIEVLRDQEFRAALTTDAHPNDYRQIRSVRSGMRIWLDDPTDPHRAWVASVKDPDALAAVLRERGAA